MPEPLTIATGLALTALGGFAWDTIKGAVKGAWDSVAQKPLQDALEAAVQRFTSDGLSGPPIDRALRCAMGSATRALAYHLHDPKRGPMTELLENVSDWPAFAVRFAERAQNNIVAGTPRDHWLARLIDESKEPNNFADIPLNLVLDDHEISRVLRSNADGEFREHLHREFLAWVERHVPDNGHKPKDFATVVRQGWTTGSKPANPLTFYDILCLFFREALIEETEVFRAFSAHALTGLQQDMDEIKRALPDPATLRQFEEVLRTFEEKDFDANYSRFKIWTRRQNEKQYRFLREQFAGLHEHLDQQDRSIGGIDETTKRHREETRSGFSGLRRWGMWILALLVALSIGWFIVSHHNATRTEARLQTMPDQVASAVLAALSQQGQMPRDAKTQPPLDFPSAFRTAAERFLITPNEAERVVNNWIAEKRSSPDLSERARAEFLAKHFPEAARLSDEAAADKLARSRALGDASRQLADEAVSDLTRAGEALRAEGRFQEALTRFEKALEHAPRAADPGRWASLQSWLGICHNELGIRVEDDAASIHLRSSVSAYRDALQVYTREQLPQDWAMTQNNLGLALSAQARRSEGPEAVRLLGEAVSAYREALQVYTREQLPQDWAMTQNNLGIALRSQAGRRKGPEAVRLLGEAVSAYREALQVRMKEHFPRQNGVTARNLHDAEVELAKLRGNTP